jgi:snRNA-activating protein complex (SNAPc), subunit 3
MDPLRELLSLSGMHDLLREYGVSPQWTKYSLVVKGRIRSGERTLYTFSGEGTRSVGEMLEMVSRERGERAASERGGALLIDGEEAPIICGSERWEMDRLEAHLSKNSRPLEVKRVLSRLRSCSLCKRNQGTYKRLFDVLLDRRVRVLCTPCYTEFHWDEEGLKKYSLFLYKRIDL